MICTHSAVHKLFLAKLILKTTVFVNFVESWKVRKLREAYRIHFHLSWYLGFQQVSKRTPRGSAVCST